jgi:hypothetical protein
MSSQPYQFVEEQENQPLKWPERVQILFDEYKKASREASKTTGRKIRLDYMPETLDYLEKLFDDRAREKPDSLKVTIHAIYRVKNKNNEEFYFYAATKTCKNALNQDVPPFSYERYGYHKQPVIKMQWKEAKEGTEPAVTGFKHGFELKWDKEEVKKLLDSSSFPCTQFYVGSVGETTTEIISGRHYQIQNREDFLNGSFEDLMDLGRLGISYREESLYLIPAARKKERENREATVGMREPKLYS